MENTEMIFDNLPGSLYIFATFSLTEHLKNLSKLFSLSTLEKIIN